MIRVLFVCLGNICRSPTAEGVFSKVVADEGLQEKIHVDSAGTHAYHVGEPPDLRSQQAAIRRGIDISGQQARRVTNKDFETFDYILAMDQSNLEHLLSGCPRQYQHKVGLFLEHAAEAEKEVPDPYYGGGRGFERVLDLVESASRGLLKQIVTKDLPSR